MTTPVNSIDIPERFVAIAAEWYDGIDDMLYAVASTGGLTTGTNCPILDYTDIDDRNNKWYLTLWRRLADSVGDAHRIAQRNLYGMIRNGSYPEEDIKALSDDCRGLLEFRTFADLTVLDLESEYNLEDWE